MLRSLALAAVVAALAGCETHDAEADPPAHGSSAAQDALCASVMVRARTCTDDFVPALIDARARRDVPPGFAARVAADRDGAIRDALVEWGQDDAACDRIAGALPDDAWLSAQACLAVDTCGGFARCIVPVFEKHFTN
ncbi:MAG TPA: hypothetical protein VLX92_32115 [Kofleriaceae bacterium]|nr:hypothetical protein [Kofleriaceae bacterium]